MNNLKIKKTLYEDLLYKNNDYLFNSLGIDNFNKPTSPLRHYYKFIEKFHKKIKGDLFEFGVFNGRSLLATSLLLKKIKSKKKIYAFDNFKGFTSFHSNDNLNKFNKNHKIYKQHLLIKKCLNLNTKKLKINNRNISTSGIFKSSSYTNLRKKINYLNLDNIIIVKGNFEKTVLKFFKSYKKPIFSANMDCDLYLPYKLILPIIFDKLQKNGYIHIDEYFSLKFPGCKIAVDEYCNEKGIKISKNKTFIWEFDRYFLKK